jgi:hypothetical protein
MVRCRWGSALFVARPSRRSQIDIGRGAAHSEPLAGQRHDSRRASPQAIAAILNENPLARLSSKSALFRAAALATTVLLRCLSQSFTR